MAPELTEATVLAARRTRKLSTVLVPLVRLEIERSSVFRGYRAQVDWAGAHVWRELAVAYPEAKVVHSVRPETVSPLDSAGRPRHLCGVRHARNIGDGVEASFTRFGRDLSVRDKACRRA